MDFFKYLIENWPGVLAYIVALIFATHFAYRWMQKPREEQINDMKEWLKIAVVEAEKQLGSGTGELKLRSVYEKAISFFPWVATFVSFEQFNEYVKEALVWMEHELTVNPSIATYVGRE